MVTAILVDDGVKGTVIDNCRFDNYDVGVELINADLALKDSVFNNVATAVKGTGNTPIHAENVTHNECHWGGGDTTPLDIVRKFANANV